MGLYKFYKESSPLGKTLIVIGGLGAGAIAWFAILNPIRKAIIAKLGQAKIAKEGKEAGDQLKDLSKQGVKPTINEAQAESFCNSIVQAISGCGTDEEAIYGVMKQMKNDADIYLVMSKFGVRKYDGCNWEFDFGDKENSLSGVISDELDSFEKDEVNKSLKDNGVSFQFT